METLDDRRVLADIFAEFLTSNLKGWRSMQDIFDHAPKDMKTHITYFHLGIPYLATIFYFNGNEDVPWLNIKLCTNGYHFSGEMSSSRVKRHRDDRWLMLSKRQVNTLVFDMTCAYLISFLLVRAVQGHSRFVSGAVRAVQDLVQRVYLQGLCTACKRLYLTYVMFARQVDIKLYSEDKSKPHVLVGFESGTPDFDYDQRGSFRRG